MGIRKSKRIEIVPSCLGELSTLDCQGSARPENIAAGRVFCALAQALGPQKPLIRSRKLLLVGEDHAFNSQLTDGFLWIAGIGLVCGKETQCIVIHAAPHHGLGFQELKFRCPFWVGSLEMFVSLFGFLLACC
ncbi:MAG: hypothetical protein ABSC48_00330 [Terracidiphilus sp.]